MATCAATGNHVTDRMSTTDLAQLLGYPFSRNSWDYLEATAAEITARLQAIIDSTEEE